MELLIHEAKQIHPAVSTEPTSFVSITVSRTREQDLVSELKPIFNTAAMWPIFTDTRVLCVEGGGEKVNVDKNNQIKLKEI